MCGSEEEETSIREGDWDKLGNIIEKIIRFNEHTIEHELERVTSLRTLCAQAKRRKHKANSESKSAQTIQLCEVATNTTLCEDNLSGPSEI